ncbi:hypothetical protein J6590_073780 [Homalodisca vitripennis]|nr:hypothetical protein J6590_073780 [Homalodisca vitripennis]
MLAVVSRSVLHEHLSGKRNNSLPLIFVKICQYEVYFCARLDDSSVSVKPCCYSLNTSPVVIHSYSRIGWGIHLSIHDPPLAHTAAFFLQEFLTMTTW